MRSLTTYTTVTMMSSWMPICCVPNVRCAHMVMRYANTIDAAAANTPTVSKMNMLGALALNESARDSWHAYFSWWKRDVVVSFWCESWRDQWVA